MIVIDDYESANRWLDEVIKDTTDYDLRTQYEDLQKVLDELHEETEGVEELQDALTSIRHIVGDL